MTKKASELKKGDATVMGEVIAFFSLGRDKVAVLCEGGRWFSYDSGDERVEVKTPKVKARDAQKGQVADLGPVRLRIARVIGPLEHGHFLLVGYNHVTNAPDWAFLPADYEFEVVE